MLEKRTDNNEDYINTGGYLGTIKETTLTSITLSASDNVQ